MCSIWLVVLVAANRYWAVCRPHVTAGVWTTRRTVIYVSAVVFGVVAFNVPRMMEYRIESVTVVPSTSPANTTADPLDYYSYSTAHIETESESETEWRLREVTTDFGRSTFYRYVYKVVFVNILLVLLPLVMLVVLSVFVIRALRQTPSYRLSLVHTKARLPENQALPSSLPAADASPAVVQKFTSDEVVEDDDVTVDNEDQRPQQQQQLTCDHAANMTTGCDKDVKADSKFRSKFRLKFFKVSDASASVVFCRLSNKHVSNFVFVALQLYVSAVSLSYYNIIDTALHSEWILDFLHSQI